jgi:hypothetical protein
MSICTRKEYIEKLNELRGRLDDDLYGQNLLSECLDYLIAENSNLESENNELNLALKIANKTYVRPPSLLDGDDDIPF